MGLATTSKASGPRHGIDIDEIQWRLSSMYVRKTATGVIVQAPAKLNLFFEVLKKRSDGYHEIETLMVPIGLYDTLYLRGQETGPVTAECQWSAGEQQARREQTTRELGDLPTAGDNLAVRAVELLRHRAAITRSAQLTLIKRIPSAAGLGGASSDAAAALLAADCLWQLGWSRERLARLAAELGSDVPFFLFGGPAICRGRGERIEPARGIGPLHAVVVRPPCGLSTAEVYRRCRPVPEPEPRRLEGLINALRRGDYIATARLLCNRLQRAASGMTPWVERLEREFDRFDCVGHQMTGSGSSYFAICRHARHARRIALALQSRNVGRVYAVCNTN